MTTQNYNRVQIVYNAEHKPYLYGAVHIIDGDLNSQRWESPFILSKQRSDGIEVVYGTVTRTMEKIVSQLERLKRFQSETQSKLDAAGIVPVNLESPTLPESEVTDKILDEQEELLEDVLMTVSVNVRILSEIFPQKFRNCGIAVYDYDDKQVSSIELGEISDLLVHNRYIVVKDEYVVDLISDEKFMAKEPQMGLKISVLEYFAEVMKAVDSITVKDLVSRLWGITKQVSASSSIKDIIFLTQNLYTMGGLVVGSDMDINSSPLKGILDRVLDQYLKRMYPASTAPEGTQVPVAFFFQSPRFYLEPDFDQKQIRIQMSVGSSPESLVSETLVMDYEEFFSQVIKASGNRQLNPIPVG